MIFVRVVAPYFVAGAEFNAQGRMVRTAPILRRYARGGLSPLVTVCMERGWEWELVE